MKKVNWLISDNNITVNYDGQTHTVARTDVLASRLIQALKDKKYDDIPNLVSASKRVEEFGKGNFVVRDGEILINGVAAPAVLGNKIVKFANEGLPHQPLVKFAENLQQNPSFRAVNELFQFLEKNDHPITENGCFIAYKKVRENFTDVHTGKMDNSVGKIVEMPRNKVNEDATVTCSYGLHVANWNYASNFYAGGIMLEIEVNPADVVAVPVDYDQAKMRVCKYKVLGVVDKEHSSDMSLRQVTTEVLNTTSYAELANECYSCGQECDDEYCEECEEEDEDFECDYCGEEESFCSCDEEEEEEEEDDDYPWEDELD